MKMASPDQTESSPRHVGAPVEDNAPAVEPPAIEKAVADATASSELEEYLDFRQQRRNLIPRAALVGFLAGSVAIVFRALLAGGDSLRNGIIAWAQQAPAIGWIAPMLFSAAGAVAAVVLVRNYAPEASGSGIPHIEAVLHRLRDLNWRRVLPVKLVGGTLAIGAGLALGREGPTVQMGSSVGAAVAEWLHSSMRERLVLIAAGAGAGLAAAFNAPLAGLVFVLEEVQRDFRPVVFGAAFIAAAVADILARLVAGQFPVFTIPSYAVPPMTALPAFALLGVVAALFGIFFNRSLLYVLQQMATLSGRNALLVTAAIGATTGLIGWIAPGLIGGGHGLTEVALVGRVALGAIPLIFALRFGQTILSYGTGAPGGIFAPLLVLGALMGLAAGNLVHSVAPWAAPDPAVFAVIGMAAYFTAIVRAPLTGIVLIVEMTGNYNQMLPLLVACFCAYAVAESLHDIPIYEALLQRDLRRGGLEHEIRQPMVIEMVVEPEAPFVGRQIRQLGLPPGCIIVRCRQSGREWVPNAGTRLEPHMRVTAMIAPEAQQGLLALRHGCGIASH